MALSLQETGTTQLEIEPNNEWEQGTTLGQDQEATGRLYHEDSDFWSFKLEKPQFVNLQFETSKNSSDYELVLFKGDDTNPIDGIKSADGQKIDFKVGLTAGKYYLQVKSDQVNDPQDYYTLHRTSVQRSNLEIEPNNTLKFANSLPKSTAYQGRLYSQNDTDLWSFTLSDTSMFNLHFNATTDSGDFKVSLLNSAKTVLSSKTSQNGEEKTIIGKQEPGEYLIRVESGQDHDSLATYSLQLESQGSVQANKKLVSLSLSADSTHLDLNVLRVKRRFLPQTLAWCRWIAPAMQQPLVLIGAPLSQRPTRATRTTCPLVWARPMPGNPTATL